MCKGSGSCVAESGPEPSQGSAQNRVLLRGVHGDQMEHTALRKLSGYERDLAGVLGSQ